MKNGALIRITRVLRYLEPSKPHIFMLLHERNNEKHIPLFPELQKKRISAVSKISDKLAKPLIIFLRWELGIFTIGLDDG